MAQAKDVFLEHVRIIREMRQAASDVAIAAGITSGVDALCTLFIADRIGDQFYSKTIVALGGFNCAFSIKLLTANGLIESVPGEHADRRTRPLRLTDKGRHVIAQLEAAMTPATESDRMAA